MLASRLSPNVSFDHWIINQVYDAERYTEARKNSTINQNLPPELLIRIFQFLSASELKRASTTCYYWRLLVVDLAPRLSLRRLQETGGSNGRMIVSVK